MLFFVHIPFVVNGMFNATSTKRLQQHPLLLQRTAPIAHSFCEGFTWHQGRSQTFSFGGATGGASFATRGAVNGLCRTFRKRPEKFWGRQAKFWGNSGPPGTPLAPPLPGMAFTSCSQHYFVVIAKPMRQVHKGSHCGSKQQ